MRMTPMPAAPETLKVLEEARACAERVFHTSAAAASKAAHKQARDLFGRLAAWAMHHFEEIGRAEASLGESGKWIAYAPVDFNRTDPGLSDRKDLWDRAGVQYFNESESLSIALENARACHTMFLGLAAKAKVPDEREFWTALVADADLHVKVVKEQVDSLRADGRWTWLDILAKGPPKPALAAARQAVSLISPISDSELQATPPPKAGSERILTNEDTSTVLLAPGWEQLKPPVPTPGRSPFTMPEPPAPAPQPAPPAGGGWVSIEKQDSVTPDTPRPPSDWVPMPPPVPAPRPMPSVPHARGPSTVRHVGRPIEPGKPSSPDDTSIMDRPQAYTGGRWVYEASLKTAAQLTHPKPPPPDADALALITGPCRKTFLDVLNRRGAQGWELLQLAFNKDTVVLFWKRRE